MKIETQDGLKLEIDHFSGEFYGDVYYEDSSHPEHTTFIPLDKLPEPVQAEFKNMVADARAMITKAKGLLLAEAVAG